MSKYAPDFAAVSRVQFGKMVGKQEAKPDQPKGRQAFTSRINKRRFASLQAASEAVDMLPQKGEALHGIMIGFYDLMHLLIVLLEKMGSPCQVMRIATLSLSRRNVQEMATLIDTKAAGKIDLLTSDFFRKHDDDIFNELLQEFKSRGQRVGAARSHCKVVTIALEDGRRFIIEGSANLRTNRNLEQFALTQSPELHGFYDGWINDMVTANEVHERNDSQTG